MLGERLFEECDRTIVLRSLKVHARETCRRGQIVRIELARLCESALRLVEVVAIEQPESEPPPGRRVRAIQLDRAPYIADGIIRLPDARLDDRLAVPPFRVRLLQLRGSGTPRRPRARFRSPRKS